MKAGELKIGGTYLTRIAGKLTPVTVVCEAPKRDPKHHTAYRVRHVDASNGALLPKPRTAAALRPIPATVVHMKDQPWAVLVTRDYSDTSARFYRVRIPTFNFAPVSFEAKDAPTAAVLAARGLVAATIFDGLGAPPAGLFVPDDVPTR